MKNNLEDLASERAVLAALCQYGLDCYLEIDFVDADHFTDDMNQLLFHCIYKSVSENAKVELASILTIFNRRRKIPQVLLNYNRRTIDEGKKLKVSDGWSILSRIIKMTKYL